MSTKMDKIIDKAIALGRKYERLAIQEKLPEKKEVPISIRCSTGEKIGRYEADYIEGYNQALIEVAKIIGIK